MPERSDLNLSFAIERSLQSSSITPSENTRPDLEGFVATTSGITDRDAHVATNGTASLSQSRPGAFRVGSIRVNDYDGEIIDNDDDSSFHSSNETETLPTIISAQAVKTEDVQEYAHFTVTKIPRATPIDVQNEKDRRYKWQCGCRSLNLKRCLFCILAVLLTAGLVFGIVFGCT